jgi:toxin ParE1/3/4
MRLELSAAAERDIDAIHIYGMGTFGRKVADDYVRNLLDLLDLLQLNPMMAMERSDLKRKTRVLRYKSHLIFYRLNSRGIKVQRVLHGSQNWVKLM